MLGQNLRQLYESLGPVECYHKLEEGLRQRLFKPEDFSLRELAEAFCGHAWVQKLAPDQLSRYSAVPVQEAGEGVDVAAFSNITGQLLFSKILDGWKNATLVSERLFATVPSKLSGEKWPWLSHVLQEGDTGIKAGMPYPEANFGERYITTPATTKQGLIVSVTKELIFFDLTGQVLRAAGEVGYKLGYNKEKRCLKVLLGLVNNYQLNGTAANTYLTVAGASPNNYVNALSGAPLVDWTSINQALILFSKILDPDTGNPVIMEPKQLFVMPARYLTARRIVSATEIRSTSPSFNAASPPAVDSPGNVQMVSGNPLPWNLEVLTSPIAYQLLLASGLTDAQIADYWFIGDFQRSFWYVENWPIQTVQAPPNSIKEFEQDIVLRFKASERGVAASVEPRYVAEFWNS